MSRDADQQAAARPATCEVADGVVRCGGDWTVTGLAALPHGFPAAVPVTGGSVTIDCGDITRLDTTGAWQLIRLQQHLAGRGATASMGGLAPAHAEMLQRVRELADAELPPPPRPLPLPAAVGRHTIEGIGGTLSYFGFVGELSVRMGQLMLRPWRIRWPVVVADMYRSGFLALGIVGLLSFLMGVVIAYQGAVQLRIYGANIYVADLVGLALVRELAPLLTAIIVAGRTGSAYTAQIGTMRVTEEVAALETIGIPPLDLLVIPKVLSLMIALPLLSVFADIMGVLGGMLMSKIQLGLGFAPFLDRLSEAVSYRSFMLGLLKAPVFAIIIATVGCYQGFRVEGSAESVGHHTTIAVVQSIFAVILADALFSVLYSWLGI